MNLQISAAFIISLSIIFLFGVSVGVYQIFPYSFLNETKDFFTNLENNKETKTISIDQNLLTSLIKIDTEEDIKNKKIALIEFMWKDGTSLPNTVPSNIEKNISDNEFDNMTNLKQINKIHVDMEYKVNSIAYHFISNSSNNELIILHNGHSGGFQEQKIIIQEFLNRNYDVIAFSMPLLGLNNQPIVEDSNFGRIHLVNHNTFHFIENKNFSPMKFFVHPITLSLNYVENQFAYDSINMIGISGGGWTTILYAAIDDRISKSFPVAGSLPISLRMESRDIGDYEQTHSEFYAIANYLELYVMGSYGENRKQIHIFNKFDPCCFAGDLSKNYEDIIKDKLIILGKGHFDIDIDESNTKHSISKNTLTKIFVEIEK